MAKGGNTGKLGDKAPKWRGYSADPEIQAFVVGQVRDGQRSAPEIKRLLLEEIGVSPSERTLQKMVKCLLKSNLHGQLITLLCFPSATKNL